MQMILFLSQVAGRMKASSPAHTGLIKLDLKEFIRPARLQKPEKSVLMGWRKKRRQIWPKMRGGPASAHRSSRGE